MTFDFDPTDGPHIASNLSDQEPDFLQQVVAIELAIRMDETDYQLLFHQIAEHRAAWVRSSVTGVSNATGWSSSSRSHPISSDAGAHQRQNRP